MAFINLHLDSFWHKKEAAASTVCLTGFPCHFFWFFPRLVFLLNCHCKNIALGSGGFFTVLLQTQYAPEAPKSCTQCFCLGSCNSSLGV